MLLPRTITPRGGISVTENEDYKYIYSTIKVMACIKSYVKTQKVKHRTDTVSATVPRFLIFVFLFLYSYSAADFSLNDMLTGL